MSAPVTAPSLLDVTLASAARDRQLATPDGQRVARLTDGVRIKPLTTRADARGSVFELFDPRWAWHPDPLVYATRSTPSSAASPGTMSARENGSSSRATPSTEP
jgi:dTDP-4-dehydrorhamnose 3,5-epimerase